MLAFTDKDLYPCKCCIGNEKAYKLFLADRAKFDEFAKLHVEKNAR
jgi:hypothetical protein